MKSGSDAYFGLLLNVLILLVGISKPVSLQAEPAVCNYDCKAHSKTRYPCGVKITWKSQSTKWCEDVNYPVLWACEAARSTACKLGGAFEESGPQGPKMYYEKFQLLPYEKLFSSNPDIATAITILSRTINYHNMQMINNKGMKKGFDTTLETAGENSNVVVQQGQALDNWAKWAGIVCTKDDYENLKNNMPFYYLKQIPMSEFCQLRWRHLSNNWANGFERNRSRLECESTWGLQGLERGPLTFTCGNRNASLEANKEFIDASTAGDYESYVESTRKSVEEFLENVDWSKTKEVKDANKEVLKAESDLFASQMKAEIFEAQIDDLDAQIERENQYKKELEEKLGRIFGFVESYKTFMEAESVKLDNVETEFVKRSAELQETLSTRGGNIRALDEFNKSLEKIAQGTSTLTSSQLSILESDFQKLLKSEYSHACVSRATFDLILSLQGIQAYRIDLADRLKRSLEYFEETSEFDEARKVFIDRAQTLADIVSSKNYIYGQTFETLKRTPSTCQKFSEGRLILDALKHSYATAESSAGINAIRIAFVSRLASLKNQQLVLDQKVSIRNQIYSLSKEMEDAFNNGYTTQLLLAQRSARSKIVATSDYARALLSEDDFKVIGAEISQKLAYFDTRSQTYLDSRQLRIKLQNRLSRLINSIADYKDEADSSQTKIIASDVESYLKFVFGYNPDRVSATVPVTQDLSELAGYDGYLSDIEERFRVIKELNK